jgi:hypothetical protein
MKKLIKRPVHNIFHFFIITIIVWLSFTCTAYAWLIYSKPEFRGRIIDAETKETIEGTVVVVLYDKQPLIGGLGSLGGVSSYVFHAKETLTDSKGEFLIPAYSSALLFTEDAGVRFIFYKPGYMADYGNTNIDPILTEKYFSTGNIGEELEIKGRLFELSNYTKWKGPVGIVELKKAKTYDERRRTVPSAPSNYTSQDLPLFFKAISEDRKERGLEVR